MPVKHGAILTVSTFPNTSLFLGSMTHKIIKCVVCSESYFASKYDRSQIQFFITIGKELQQHLRASVPQCGTITRVPSFESVLGTHIHQHTAVPGSHLSLTLMTVPCDFYHEECVGVRTGLQSMVINLKSHCALSCTANCKSLSPSLHNSVKGNTDICARNQFEYMVTETNIWVKFP